MNRILKTALSFGLPLSFAIAISKPLFQQPWDWSSVVVTFIIGLIIGLLYAVAMKFTLKNIGKHVVIAVAPGEDVIKEDGSTLIKGKAGFPGRLFLTDKQLIFKSKKINDKDFEEHIDLSIIQSSKERNFWMGPGNDLMITTIDNQLYRFVVYAPEEWIDAIGKRKI
jgi:hypothetical protein